MKRGGNGVGGGAPTDLLVCFPSRAHLSLLPKPICSPSRPGAADPAKRHHHHRGQASPLFRAGPQPARTGSDPSPGSEPTSPKVTCAGQIKVRNKGRPEPAGPDRSWLESVGLKKDVAHFLGALRGLHFHFRCFGALPSASDADSDSDEEGEEEEGAHDGPGNVFSKWFMVLEEKEQQSASNEVLGERDGSFDDDAGDGNSDGGGGGGSEAAPAPAPPPNALLLMRCRSAPARNSAELEKEKEKEKEREERLVLMSYAPDFFKVSTEIAKETWVVGSVDPLARSRSWKR